MKIIAVKHGQWKRTQYVLQRLPSNLRRELDRGVKEEAQAAVRRLKHNIFHQNYPHAPLKPETAKRKEKEGKDPRILIEDGEYVRAIKEIHLGWGHWGVGVTDERLAEIGATHEWGSEEKRIPPRPHYRIELERIRSGGLRSLREGIIRALGG